VCPVQLENVIDTPDALDDVDVLVLSYEFQKPPAPGIHYALAGWVSRGGSLLYVGDGTDPYHEIRSWWTGRYDTCADHLAEALGADRNRDGVQPIGQGRSNPQLGIVRQRELGPGQLTWLRDLTYDEESLLASAGRVVDWQRDQAGIRFGCEAPRGVQVTTALRVPADPAAVRADGADVIDLRYDAGVRVLWLQHPGVPAGTRIEIDF